MSSETILIREIRMRICTTERGPRSRLVPLYRIEELLLSSLLWKEKRLTSYTEWTLPLFVRDLGTRTRMPSCPSFSFFLASFRLAKASSNLSIHFLTASFATWNFLAISGNLISHEISYGRAWLGRIRLPLFSHQK